MYGYTFKEIEALRFKLRGRISRRLCSGDNGIPCGGQTRPPFDEIDQLTSSDRLAEPNAGIIKSWPHKNSSSDYHEPLSFLT